ncbi:MAG: TonB-dependent receptor plug domain-containing protein [Crocinitomix sp.]|nr:TonB-dependent receptor plug domain-containing protein [Crocinitomix sp.]
MKHLSLIITFYFALFNIGAIAQTGEVSGKVFRQRGNTQEPLYMPIAKLTEDGLRKVGQTDFDGMFSINLPEGENVLVLRSMALRTDTIRLNIKAGESISINHEMIQDGQLKMVTVMASAAIEDGGSEKKAIADIKDDDKVVSIITGSMIANKGASDVGSAAKKITGLSTVGSTLYVRGLGDRYNVAYLNGLPIPSPHPDFRVVPLSVFPTDIVNSIQVSKVMSSELYGDFSGGAFNVTTKSFYNKPTLKVTLGTGMNTQTTFNDFRTYSGGKFDYFGFDDGTRQIPDFVIDNSKTSAYPAVNNLYNNGLYNSVEGKTTGFHDNFGTQLNQALPNTNFSITAGNFFPATKSDSRSKGFGYLVLLSHDNSYKYANGSMKIINAQSEERLNYDFDKYTKETATTGLLNLYYRINPNNNISFNTLFVNNSSDEVRETWGEHFDYSRSIYSRRLTYQQNFMSVNQIIGTHQLLPFEEDSALSRLTVDWRGSYSTTGSQEPDRRQFVAFYDEDQKENTENYAVNFIDRNENHIFHSKLRENEIAGKFNARYVLMFGDVLNKKRDTVAGEVITLNLGADYKKKTRIFDYKQFNYVLNALATDLGDNLDIYNMDSYLSSTMHDEGQFSISEVANFGSSYVAQLDVMSFYSDIKFKLNKWQIIPGLRYESGAQTVENRNQQSPSSFEKTILLSDALLPSLITRFDANEKNVFRFVASKTLTRPKFNEVAPFQYVLYFAGAKAQGNTNLQNGINYNADFRYERYGKPGELFSVGAFYKYLDNPIEQTMRATASGQLMSFANANAANVAGVEIEYMRSLNFLVLDSARRDSSFLNDLNVGFNATYMYTSVQIDTTDSGAINTNAIRPLEGASPYLVNFDLSYLTTKGEKGNEKTYLAALSYNVFGPRLFAVGSNGIGDQYQRPINTLNFVGKVTFNDTYSFGLKAKNLLNPTIDIVQENQVDPSQPLNVSNFKRGIDLSLSFSYNIPVSKKKKEKADLD